MVNVFKHKIRWVILEMDIINLTIFLVEHYLIAAAESALETGHAGMCKKIYNLEFILQKCSCKSPPGQI